METEGRKKEGPCIFILHILVSPQSGISHASSWKHESSQQHNHRELLHSCTWSIEFGQGYAPGKSHLYIMLCFTGDNAYWNCPSVVTLCLQLLEKLVSISWNSCFLEEYFLGEVNTTYVRCFASWPLLLARNVKITSNAGDQKSIRVHV